MKLQIALDTLNIEESLDLLDEIHDEIDIVEVGTPFIIREGVKPVEIFKERYDDIEILADLKIMDAGGYESKIALDKGADIVTVMALTNKETIVSTINECHKYGKKAMIDMMNVDNLAEMAKEFVEMGADYICVHTAFDVQSSTNNPVKDLELLCANIDHNKAAVAGGVKLETIDLVAKEKPGIIIVGGAISNAQDRKQMTLELKKHMEEA